MATIKKAPILGGKPMEPGGCYYAGATIHWLDKKGKHKMTDRFPKKSEMMTVAAYKKMFGEVKKIVKKKKKVVAKAKTVKKKPKTISKKRTSKK